jgi:hypothetical protein
VHQCHGTLDYSAPLSEGAKAGGSLMSADRPSPVDAWLKRVWGRTIDLLIKLGLISMPCEFWHARPSFYAYCYPCPRCGKRIEEVEK